MADPNNPFGYNSAYVPKPATGLEYSPTYEPPVAPSVPSKSGLATSLMSSAATAGIGLATGGTGWLTMGAIQLVGGLLGAFTREPPHRNPMEVEYENMVDFYREIGARSTAARTVAAVATGKPVSSFSNIGLNDADAMNLTMDKFNTIRTKTAPKITGGNE